MSAQRCPTCGILVEAKSLSCVACGARLHDGSTWPTPLQPAGPSGGALWLDDLGSTDTGPEATPLDLTFELREIKQPLLPPGATLPTLRAASRPLARPPAAATSTPAAPPPLPRGAPLLPPVPPALPKAVAAQPAALPGTTAAPAAGPPPMRATATTVDPPPAAWRTAPPRADVHPHPAPAPAAEAAPELPPPPAAAPAAAAPKPAPAPAPAPTPTPPAPWHEATPDIEWPAFEDLPDLHPSQIEPPIVLPAPDLPLPTLQAPIRPPPVPPPPVLRRAPVAPEAGARPTSDLLAPALPTPLAAQYAEARRPPDPVPARPAADMPPPEDVARRRANKVAARGAVRRARLQNVAAQLSTAPEILVLDRDAGARYELCALLQGFGFQVQATADTAEAAALTASGRFAAAFVDVPLDAADGGAGIELCRRVRENNQRQGGSGTLLVLVAAQLRPLDRVRADLAGCDEAIVKPVSRGSVARVLDERGIPLPSDARRV